MQLNLKTPLKTNEIVNSGFYFTPRDKDKILVNFYNGITKIATWLFDYFSTETGRKRKSKTISLSELMEIHSLSKGSIKDAIKKLKANEVFLIHEDKSSKEKIYTFFLDCEENRKIFEDIKNGKGELKKRTFCEYVENKITDFIKKISPSEQKNVSKCQKIDRIENAKTDEIKEIEPISKISQESYKEENNIKNHTYQEKENNIAIKKETEIIKNECDDFKDFKKDEKIQEIKILSKEQEIKNNKEDILKNFGIKTKSLKNLNDILELEKQVIMDSIEKVKSLEFEGKCKNRYGFLLSILKKATEENKNNPYEIKKEPESKVSEELKNRFIDFCVKNKVIYFKMLPDAYGDTFFNLLSNKYYLNKDFLLKMKEIISYDELKLMLDNHIKKYIAFKSKFFKHSEELLLNFKTV